MKDEGDDGEGGDETGARHAVLSGGGGVVIRGPEFTSNRVPACACAGMHLFVTTLKS